MTYYNYHGIIRKKILDGLLTKYEFVEKWNTISPALVLYFEDGSVYPIREHRFGEYIRIIQLKQNNYL